MKLGRQTTCTIISKLDDPDWDEAERVVIKDAVFDYIFKADANIFETSYSENAGSVANSVKIDNWSGSGYESNLNEIVEK